ncbi:carboxyl-terminal processing protease [Natranaerovirga pectinivora]|uniref:Carboxyl-terminal processing protease n=1 Tax=Natranaerovirga pectinivora TaxID=682400 RepID=A0A4R3MNE5_9FIRM|nr:S41 family peptidase [Natranaerovirga pectinivora]TCT14209.1 carboxyl-terminal processing protease [Natranaerovirga pectinivora]
MNREYLKGLISGFTIILLIGAIYIGSNNFVDFLQENGIYFEGTGVQELEVDEKINKIIRYLDNFYYEDFDTDEILDRAFKGMVAGIGDPYSTYYTEDEFRNVLESAAGEYSGIGVVISHNEVDDEFIVLLPFVGGPGDKAGLLPGDIIIQVDGISIEGMDLTETVNLIKGEVGTEVVLTIIRNNDQLEVPIIREKIDIPTVSSEMLEDNIGYLRISEFDRVTYNQFMDAINELENQGQNGLIIDLRNNPGGMLHTVIAIVDELIPKNKIIVYTEDKHGRQEIERSKTGTYFDRPLVILINEHSASASEILAGAIKDHGAGTLVGTTTFGKGLVQRLIPLGDGTAIKTTISRYFTPSGNYIHDRGIEPDVEVILPDELRFRGNLTLEEDLQLQKALEIINEKIK